MGHGSLTNVNIQFQNFNAGEVSPKVYGRSDLLAYFNGVRRMENFLCQTQGPAVFRAGFHFIAETKGGNKAFLQRFQFSDEQAYILEFTNLNIRIYKDRGVLLNSGVPVDVVTPYLLADLFEIKFAQNATDLYIVHPNHQPRKLTRSAITETTWTLSIHTPVGIVPPFLSQDVTNITQADPAVVTYDGADNFLDGDTIRMDNVVGMTEVNGINFIVNNLNAGANTFELTDSSGTDIDSTGFGAYVSGGDLYNVSNCPSAVTFYEQRLIYGGTTNNPETLWFSQSALVDNFTVGTGATDGIQYTVAAGEDVNKIEWIKGTQDFLAIGGFGDVLRATGGEGQEAIAPNQISIKPTNTIGSADINPVGKNQFIGFVQRDQRTLRTFELLPLEGLYRPIDRNIAADHITESGMTQISFQEGRPSILWATRTDGQLIGLTLEREQQVSGWHRHKRNGNFISIATAPRVKDFDDLYACVEVNGTFHIEHMNDLFDYPKIEDFVTDDEAADLETWQRAMFEAQKKYIHLNSA